MSTSQSWSAEMDRKIVEMKRDPDQYFTRARQEARRESTGFVPKGGKK